MAKTLLEIERELDWLDSLMDRPGLLEHQLVDIRQEYDRWIAELDALVERNEEENAPSAGGS